LKEENCKPISELPSETQGCAEAAGSPESNLQVVVAQCKENPPRSDDAAPAQAIDDGIDRFITAEVTPELEDRTESRHELDEVVHKMLLTGLALSTILIVVGLLLSGIYHRQLPSAATGLHQVLRNLKAGDPSGFLDIGILFLIATPILRVFGSLADFIYRRDWRYAAITSIVLLILAISVLVGRG
jgi:uncharacterized membrane protein